MSTMNIKLVTEGTVNNLQLEQSKFPTLYREHGNNRTAPVPELVDFLPNTGHVAGWIDITKDPDNPVYIFENKGTGDKFNLYLAGDDLVSDFFGDIFIPSDTDPLWQSTEKRRIGFILAWTETTWQMFIRNDQGNTYNSGINDITIVATLDDNDVNIGTNREGNSHSSIYFYTLTSGEKDSFLEEEASALLDALSKGILNNS